MGLKQAGFSDGLPVFMPVSDATDSMFRKEVTHPPEMTGTSVKAPPNPLALRCFMYVEGQWFVKQLSPYQETFTLGDLPGCDIKVSSSSRKGWLINVKLFNDQWLIVEADQLDALSINGMRRHQSTLGANESIVLTIDDVTLVLSTMDERKASNSQDIKTPQNRAFGLRINGLERHFPANSTVLLGSHPICDARLASSEFAAVISSVGKHIFLFSMYGLNQNDSDDNLLSIDRGCEVEIDGNEVEIIVDQHDVNDSGLFLVPDFADPCYCLMELDEQNALGTSLVIPPECVAINIGRAPDNTLQLPAERVSRYHAELSFDERGIVLADKASRNGTYVNGERIAGKPCVVNPGDVIRFGDRSFAIGYSQI